MKDVRKIAALSLLAIIAIGVAVAVSPQVAFSATAFVARNLAVPTAAEPYVGL
jgi:hypothetical protein